MSSLILHELRARRGSIVGWAVGLCLYAGLYTSFYPALPAEMMSVDYGNIQAFQAFGNMDMSSFESYMGSAVFNVLSILIAIFAVLTGVATLAGEEDDGTLEALITLPLPRWRLVVAKAVGLAAANLAILTVVAAVLTLTYAAIERRVDADIATAQLARMTLELWPLSLAFSALAMFLGALLPNRRAAAGVAGLSLIAAFFGRNLAQMIPAIEPLRFLSPFNYFDSGATALTRGIAWGDGLVLLVSALVLLVLAALTFGARDVTVGRWTFARSRSG